MVASLTTSLASWGAAVQTYGAPLILQDVPNKGQQKRQGSCSTGPVCNQHRCRTATAAVVCSLLVAASAVRTPRAGYSANRALRFETSIARSKCRRRRMAGGTGGSGDDDIWDRADWEDMFGGAGRGNGGSGGGSWGSGWGPDGQSGDAFHKALFECMWVWQLLCAVSMLQSWYFMLFPKNSVQGLQEASTSGDMWPGREVVVY